MIKDIQIPEISENVESGTVVGILVQVGDRVEADDPIIEFETDKAVVEIPAPAAGKITEILVEEGDHKDVGDVIARLDTEAEDGEKEATEEESGDKGREKEEEAAEEKTVSTEKEQKAEAKEEAPDEAPAKEAEDAEKRKEEKTAEAETPEKESEKAPEKEEAQKAGAEEGDTVPAGPAVRRLARELGVDLQRVDGTGPGDRITEADVKAFVKKGGAPKEGKTAAGKGAGRQPDLPDFERWGAVRTEKISTVRRITAEGTAVSWDAIPHVTQFDEADITDLEAFIEKNAKRVEAAGGKLTVTPVLMKVCAEALKKYPRFNASIDPGGQTLYLKQYVHIGVMVDTPRGLLVPVVRDAETKSITALAAEVVDLADRARNKKIKPDEMEGGTFSISNQGGIGGRNFTPVILWPQAAILGVSRASVAPRYDGSGFVPRTILPLSLSYDHRIVDGADAARFLRFVCECLEQPFTLHL